MKQLINEDCKNVLKEILEKYKERKIIIVSDPPFNIGCRYKSYKDKLKEQDYLNFMCEIFSSCPSVIIHYPETIYKIAFKMNKVPERVVSWVYNSNTARQHRDIAFFDVKPNFKQMIQPYKNQNDKRIKERMLQGIRGGALYDWWNVNQVKNVSKNKEKISHPCVMPLKVMENIIGILPEDALIIDPFMGTGTTGVACINKHRDFIGIEIEKEYYEIAKNRILNASLL